MAAVSKALSALRSAVGGSRNQRPLQVSSVQRPGPSSLTANIVLSSFGNIDRRSFRGQTRVMSTDMKNVVSGDASGSSSNDTTSATRHQEDALTHARNERRWNRVCGILTLDQIMSHACHYLLRVILQRLGVPVSQDRRTANFYPSRVRGPGGRSVLCTVFFRVKREGDTYILSTGRIAGDVHGTIP